MKKLHLAHLPTPITRSPALDALLGAEIWLKRDDMSSGAASGNKIRKLEYLLQHPEERDRLGQIGARRVKDVLSWDHSKASLYAAYEWLFVDERARAARLSAKDPVVIED